MIRIQPFLASDNFDVGKLLGLLLLLLVIHMMVLQHVDWHTLAALAAKNNLKHCNLSAVNW